MVVAGFSKEAGRLRSVVPGPGGEVRLREREAGLADALEAGTPQKVACRHVSACTTPLPFTQNFELCIRPPSKKSDGDSDA